MTLLVEVMEHPLDPGYEAAAAVRAERPPGPRLLSVLVTLVVAAVCGWLATVAIVELRRPQPEAAKSRIHLENEIQRRTAEVDRLQRTNEKLRADIAAAQQAALASGGGLLVERRRSLAVLSGELPVVGPGLQLTLSDAPGGAPTAGADPRAHSEATQGRVMDRDLQIVVNGLWVAGAEAIAINGERLTALSAIRSAGQAILVNFRPLSPPYVIDAIGDPKALQIGFGEDTAGPYLKLLGDSYGIRAGIATKTSVTLPGAGSLALRNASVPEPASPSGSVSSLKTPGSILVTGGTASPSASTGGLAAAPAQEVFP